MKELVDELKKRRLCVIGLGGKSGKSMLRFLATHNLHAICIDESPVDKLHQDLLSLVDKVSTSKRDLIGVSLNDSNLELQSDLILLSPGVARSKKFIANAIQQGVEIWSEIEIAYRLHPRPIIAITGTDGKSTTTSLTAHLLQISGESAVACGNIGLPFLDVQIENISQVPVVELSSYQLESVDKFSPPISVLLNIAEDHVDRYPHQNDYILAKLRIFKKDNGFSLLRLEEWEKFPVVRDFFHEFADKVGEKIFYLGLFESEEALQKVLRAYSNIFCFFALIKDDDFHNIDLTIALSDGTKKSFRNISKNYFLRGHHNLENLAFAITMTYLFHLSYSIDPNRSLALTGLESFKGLPHRFERVGSFQGIDIYNDSKATTFQAAERAVLSLQGQRIFLIAGGRGKGVDIAIFAEAVAMEISALIAIGETADELLSSFQEKNLNLKGFHASSLREAVLWGKGNCHKGDALLFSPGFASFDMFANFEQRGESFRELIYEIFTE